MNRLIPVLLTLAVCISNAWARSTLSLGFAGVPAQTMSRAERRLDSWLRAQPDIKNAMTPSLRDALASVGPLSLQQPPRGRPEALETCRTLSECRRPPMHVFLEDAGLIPEAIQTLLRPWLLLQQARGRSLEVSAAAGDEGRVLNISMSGLLHPLDLHVTALRSGRYHVWLNGRAEIAEVFAEARDAVLSYGR